LYFQKLLKTADAMPLFLLVDTFPGFTAFALAALQMSLKNLTTSWKIGGIKIKEKTVHSLAAFKSFIGIQKYIMGNR
jgi:hypothetical protein